MRHVHVPVGSTSTPAATSITTPAANSTTIPASTSARTPTATPARTPSLALLPFATLAIAAATLGVGAATLVRVSQPDTPCAKMGGQCIARTGLDVSECRTDSRPFTFVTSHEQMNDRWPASKHSWLLCNEPYTCCIEEPCASVLKGECRDSSAPAEPGHRYHSGYCPPPKYADHIMCHARDGSIL